MAGFTIGIMIRNRIIKNAPPKNQGRTRAVLVSMRCSF